MTMDQDQTNQTTIDEAQVDAELEALLTEAQAILSDHDAAAATTATTIEQHVAAIDAVATEVDEITSDLTALEDDTANQLDALVLEQADAFATADAEDAAEETTEPAAV